jgi:hypothetical protein
MAAIAASEPLVEWFNQAGIDPEKQPAEFHKFQLATMSWSHFSEYFFKDPRDASRPLILEPGQRAAIDAIQFGPRQDIVMVWPRQFGKTTGSSAGGGAIMINSRPRANLGLFGMNLKQAKNLMRRMKWFIVNSPFKEYIGDTNSKLELEMTWGSYAIANPCNENIRGDSFDYAFIDEASRIPDDIIEGPIVYTTRAGRPGRRVWLSTPRGMRGKFITYYFQGLNTRPITCKSCRAEFKQPAKFNPETFRFSCPSCGVREWEFGYGDYQIIAVDPWHSSFYTPEQIRAELDRRGWSPLARQELLGEIIPDGSSVFRDEWIQKAFLPTLLNSLNVPEDMPRYVLGVDFGKNKDATSFAVGFKEGERDTIYLNYMRTLEPRYSVFDYGDVREDILRLVKRFRPVWIVPDATGVGESVVDELQKDLKNVDVYTRIYSNKSKNKNNPDMGDKKGHKGFIYDYYSKFDLIENLINLFSRGYLRIPADGETEMKELRDELLMYSYNRSITGRILYGVQAAHDDRVNSTALMCWGCKTTPFIEGECEYG